jgi:hypothetical protein
MTTSESWGSNGGSQDSYDRRLNLLLLLPWNERPSTNVGMMQKLTHGTTIGVLFMRDDTLSVRILT